MDQAVIQLLLITTFIVLPIFAWFMVRFQPDRVKDWRTSAKVALKGTLIGIPIAFLLNKVRWHSVQDTLDFLTWYGVGFLYHFTVLYLWIALFKRIFPEATATNGSAKYDKELR